MLRPLNNLLPAVPLTGIVLRLVTPGQLLQTIVTSAAGAASAECCIFLACHRIHDVEPRYYADGEDAYDMRHGGEAGALLPERRMP